MTSPDGWTRVDTHVKVLDDRVVERAKQRGIDALVYAPHFTRLPAIEERARRYSDEELLVVPAREVFTGTWGERKHVLALGLESPVPDFVSLTGAMAEFERQGATVVVPHPEFFTVGLSESDVRDHRGVVDAVETYNPKYWARHDRRARAIADRLDLPRTASSYAHLRRTVGAAWTAFDRPIDDEADLLAAIVGDGGRRIAHRTGPGHRFERLAEFAHLGWENSYEKADRVFLSGTEPTHPDHVAYGGRFDDVAVY
ncbi:metal-dependent phosphoesterase [Halobacteriales archaeon QS_8_69_26]|nr:MAG: metal-dependent phosphoesterase [Halobacteriales archaeon QS_8_69_26]